MKTPASELVVGTFNVRDLAFDGKNRVGHAEQTLNVFWQKGCDIVGL